MRDVLAPPISTAAFQRQLDLVTRDHPVKLRIVWAPRRVEAHVIDRAGNERVYRKYPLLGTETRTYHIGTSYRRKGTIIAYHRMGDPVPWNVWPTDLAVAHIERVNHSIHIFVIEKRVPNEYARSQWEKKRELSRAKIGVDIFGPFPSEGVWDWFDDISTHHSGCCDMAAKRGVRCAGLYREPDDGDLERIKAAMRVWESRQRADATLLQEQEASDMTAALEQREANERLLLLQEIRECAALDKIAQERTRVIGGTKRPQHTTAY